MITKLILKILFKATLPLVMVVGIASYALYAAGGNPLGVLKQVGGGFGNRISALAGSAGDSIESARDKTTATFASTEPVAQETLYRWKDANGVTHFSNSPPANGQASESLKVNPNINLMSAPRSPDNDYGNATRVNLDTENGGPENMPGVAGILAPGMDPTKLLEQFKQAQELQQQRLP